MPKQLLMRVIALYSAAKKMTLIKTSLLNGIAVLIKMLTLLGINKVLAIYVGPAGYAAVGQFQNAVQMITTFASGAISTGVTKYTAEYEGETNKQHQVWRTAGTIAVVGSLVSGAVVAVYNQELASFFLKDKNFGGVFKWFSIALVFFSLNAVLLAILNGRREVLLYVISNIVGSIFALLVTATMAIHFGLYGALLALATYQSLSFIVSLGLCYRRPWFALRNILGRVDRTIALNLAKYTLMALTSAACVPISHMFIRSYLVDNLSVNDAGYWEAMWRLSAAYLLLITTTLSVYFLPRLSGSQDRRFLKEEINKGLRLIVPCSMVMGGAIFILQDFVVDLLFTKEFSPMKVMFSWQLLGDFFKVSGWMLAYIMLSRPMVKLYIATEIFFSAGFYVLSIIFVKSYGLKGAAIAHAVNYFIYLVVMYYFIFHRYLKVEK